MNDENFIGQARRESLNNCRDKRYRHYAWIFKKRMEGGARFSAHIIQPHRDSSSYNFRSPGYNSIRQTVRIARLIFHLAVLFKQQRIDFPPDACFATTFSH